MEWSDSALRYAACWYCMTLHGFDPSQPSFSHRLRPMRSYTARGAGCCIESGEHLGRGLSCEGRGCEHGHAGVRPPPGDAIEPPPLPRHRRPLILAPQARQLLIELKELWPLAKTAVARVPPGRSCRPVWCPRMLPPLTQTCPPWPPPRRHVTQKAVVGCREEEAQTPHCK